MIGIPKKSNIWKKFPNQGIFQKFLANLLR